MTIIDSLIKKKNILDIVDIIEYYVIDRIVDIRRKDYYDVIVTKGDYELSEEGVPITNPDGVANQILSFLIIVNDLKIVSFTSRIGVGLPISCWLSILIKRSMYTPHLSNYLEIKLRQILWRNLELS